MFNELLIFKYTNSNEKISRESSTVNALRITSKSIMHKKKYEKKQVTNSIASLRKYGIT